jgi:hypothetical protein
MWAILAGMAYNLSQRKIFFGILKPLKEDHKVIF